MSDPDEAATAAWDDACLAARLFAIDPVGIGGVWLRSRAGPARDLWLDLLRSRLPSESAVVRIPLNTGDERLLGGLDLTATLQAGKPVAERGLLAAADGGLVILPMAERCSAGTAARIAATLDTGEVTAERDGFALRHASRIGLVALDEGIEADERPPPSLTDRLAIHVDLALVSPRAAAPAAWPGSAVARERLADIGMPDALVEALCGAALAFGIASLRAPIQAIRVARAAAADAGRPEVSADDAALAARLVLAPRATRMPAGEAVETPEQPQDTPKSADERPQDESRSDEPPPETKSEIKPEETKLEDVVRAAVAAAIPAGLLAHLRLGTAGRSRSAGASGSGALQRDRRRGRPAGTVRGEPKRGARLNVVETLRAAAPWQPLRRASSGDAGRLAIRRDDLRITRFKRRVETTTVFVVDASGSSAFQRLAEAKGAVELLLAECYIRRDRVALMAFRGESAELILPPTRSLARAKRSLAALPGGGGTPLAAAIDAGMALAGSIMRLGGGAVLVFMTDGRANVARDGRTGREQAGLDARAAARDLRAGGATALFIDISPRPNEAAAGIAREMGAAYLPLPVADAAALSGLVRREAAASAARAAR